MQLAHRWLDRNLTKAELTIAVLIISLFISYFSHYMYAVFGKVEKKMIERTIININSALNTQSAFALLKRDSNYFDQVLDLNPMDLMTSQSFLERININDKTLGFINKEVLLPPSNYGGVVIDDDDSNLESGQWYFDQDDKLLFYKIVNDEFFSSNIGVPSRMRFRLRLEYKDNNNNNLFDLSIDDYNFLKLESIDNNRWLF